MKTIMIVIAVLMMNYSFGQDIKNVPDIKNLGKSYKMKQNYLSKKCDAVGKKLTDSDEALQRTFIVIVESLSPYGYVVSVPRFKKNEILNTKYVSTTTTQKGKSSDGKEISIQLEQEIYFLIPFSKFDSVCEESNSRHGFILGIPTIPAKLRFGNNKTDQDARYFKFEGNLNLGLSAGWKYAFGRKNQFIVNTILGFTIASVVVDSVTTKGKIKSNTSAASFSPHFGFLIDVQQFQFGLYSGIDYLSGEPNRFWVYRNQPWLGIGIGYNLFNLSGQNDENGKGKR